MAVVMAPLVIAKDDSGKQVYLYFGTEVPASIGKAEVARLSDFIDDGKSSK